MAASWRGSGWSGAGGKIRHHAEQTRNSCMFPGRIICCCCWDICVKQSDPPPERPEEKNVLKPKLGFIQVLKSLPVCLILMEETVFHLFHFFSQPVWKEAPLTVIMAMTISSFPAPVTGKPKAWKDSLCSPISDQDKWRACSPSSLQVMALTVAGVWWEEGNLAWFLHPAQGCNWSRGWTEYYFMCLRSRGCKNDESCPDGISESWCLLLDVRVDLDGTQGLASVYHGMDSTTATRLCLMFV